MDVVQAHVPLTALYAAHIGTIQARLMPEGFLAESRSLTQFSDATSEVGALLALDRGSRWHNSTFARWRL